MPPLPPFPYVKKITHTSTIPIHNDTSQLFSDAPYRLSALRIVFSSTRKAYRMFLLLFLLPEKLQNRLLIVKTGVFAVACISCMYYFACQELFQCLWKIISMPLTFIVSWWSGEPGHQCTAVYNYWTRVQSDIWWTAFWEQPQKSRSAMDPSAYTYLL